MGAAIDQVPAQRGVLGQIGDVFNVLLDPSAVFNRIKQKPSILAPWLVVSALLVITTIITQPYQNAAMQTLRASLPPEQAARMGAGGGGPLKLLGVPVVSLIFAAIGAGLLWVGVSLSGAQGKYKTLLSVLLHSNITYALFSIVTAVVLTVRGVAAVNSMADLRPPLGLDLLAPNASLFVGQLLNGINPFAIWGVWICGTGISITHGVSKSTAITVTAIIYLIAILLTSAPLLLLKTG